MDASGTDKLILLVQTNQVLYDKSSAGYKVKGALKKGDIRQIGVEICVKTIVSVLLIYYICRFSFLGGSVIAPSDFSFLVSHFSFLEMSRFSVIWCARACSRTFRYKFSIFSQVGEYLYRTAIKPRPYNKRIR